MICGRGRGHFEEINKKKKLRSKIAEEFKMENEVHQNYIRPQMLYVLIIDAFIHAALA